MEEKNRTKRVKEGEIDGEVTGFDFKGNDDCV